MPLSEDESGSGGRLSSALRAENQTSLEDETMPGHSLPVDRVPHLQKGMKQCEDKAS